MGMTIVSFTPALAAALFLGMLLLLEVGRRRGLRRLAKDPEGARHGIGAANGALFGLLGLLVAFTFSGAASRFDTRRQLVVEEANDIGTAWLRLDLLPPIDQPAMRSLFRRYLDSRLETYRRLPDIEAAEAELVETAKLQAQIWQQAVAACEAKHDTPTTSLVLTSLNTMFDIVNTRIEGARLHPPLVIFALLFGLGLGCSFLAGYDMAGSRTRSWTHILGFAGVIALSVYVILEIEYPRFGFIREDTSDRVLVELRKSME
jgi:hypothetical protein